MQFLSTPSARRATSSETTSVEGRIFLSTPSARRATVRLAATARTCAYFYPRPLRGGRPGSQPDALTVQTISIHALCEEGDDVLGQSTAHIKTFLSTPSARRATQVCGQITNLITFLSTPSARRATDCKISDLLVQEISIHALCEEGDIGFAVVFQGKKISIHALCEEGDRVSGSQCKP